MVHRYVIFMSVDDGEVRVFGPACWGWAVVAIWPWGERAPAELLEARAWVILARTTSEISCLSSAWWSPISCMDDPMTWASGPGGLSQQPQLTE